MARVTSESFFPWEDENAKGTNEPDKIHGTGKPNKLSGRGGDDTIYGYNNNDELHGDDGNDTLYGGNDSDVLHGGNNNDDLYGDDADQDPALHGKDTLYGGHGKDLLRGYGNDDYLDGGIGDDKLWGGSGNDVLFGGAASPHYTGNDKLYGGYGDDTLIGGDGFDLLAGGEGIDTADYLTAQSFINVDLSMNKASRDGDGGIDQLYSIENVRGSVFGDTIKGDNSNNKFEGMMGADSLYGMGGDDVLDAGGDLFNSREVVIGGLGSDTVIARNGAGSHYHGDAGNDQTGFGYANNANDIDTIDYSHAINGIRLELETHTGFGGWFGSTLGHAWDNGFGQVNYVTGFERVIGSKFNDSITGGSQLETLNGGDGNDILDSRGSASGGREELIGGAGSDTVFARNGLNSHYHGDVWTDKEITTATGHDVLNYSHAVNGIHLVLDSGHDWGEYDLGIAWNNGYGHAHFVTGFEEVIGSNHDDLIYGRDIADVLRGGNGTDSLYGGAGADKLYGGNGTDFLDSGGSKDGAETIVGGSGNDYFTVREGDGSVFLGDEVYSRVGTDFDTIFYSYATQGVVIDLETHSLPYTNAVFGTASNNGYGQTNYVSGIEQVIGSNHVDTITGSSGNDTLTGGLGADTLRGEGGADKFRYTSFSDSTAAQSDKIYGFESGSDTIDLSALQHHRVSGQHALRIEDLRANNDGLDFKLIDRDAGGNITLEIEFYETNFVSYTDILY